MVYIFESQVDSTFTSRIEIEAKSSTIIFGTIFVSEAPLSHKDVMCRLNARVSCESKFSVEFLCPNFLAIIFNRLK